MVNLRNFLAVLALCALSATGFACFGQNSGTALKLSTVVIDPGHGGKDAGCISPWMLKQWRSYRKDTWDVVIFIATKSHPDCACNDIFGVSCKLPETPSVCV